MSRHRDFHNFDAEEFEEDSYEASSYGSSYVEEVSLSTSVEKDYIYKRGGGGHTPKMGHFVLGRSDSVPSVPEEDEELDQMRARSDSETSSGSNTYDDMDEADKQKLAECLEKVLDIVGDTMPDSAVKDAIVRCDFDAEVAVNTLLNNPIGHKGGHKSKTAKKCDSQRTSATGNSSSGGSKIQSSTPKTPIKPVISEYSSSSKPIQISDNPNHSGASFNAVMNYADIPTLKTQTVPTLKTSGQPIIQSKLLPTPDRSRSQSPVPAFNNVNNTSTPIRVPMRKVKLDALKEYKENRGSEKNLLNLVVVGHVDSGKSTLMGHLLFKLGSVSAKTMHKYEKDSKKIGKQSFAYAWVLDETSEERERGITMDVGHNKFETNSKAITLLDAPGHKDFIPNMISGAYQADVAILVINATKGEFEAGFESGGQTREHALLVRSLGVYQLIVAVNKMDTSNWDQERYQGILKTLRQFLKQVGFRDDDVNYVPCSGFTGDFLVEPSKLPEAQWYKGKTLLEAIDTFKPPERLVDKPFRMSVSDVFKPQSSGFCVSGRIESGFVQKDDKILISPLNELASVKSVLIEETNQQPNQIAFAGDHISLGLTGPDMSQISNGMVVCDPSQPIPISKLIKARIVVFNVDNPITKGFPVIFHYGSVQTQATIKKILAEINKSSGEIIKKKPRCLIKNCNAIVELKLESSICVELYSNIKELGRFMLRRGGVTIAAGLVTEIL